MTAPRFVVAAIDKVTVTGSEELSRCDLMSAYVCPRDEHRHALLLRAVPRYGPTTGSIWHAGGHGLTFQADAAPILTPGPDPIDSLGCEDPTIVRKDGEVLVYYTGLRADGVAQLLYATGPDYASLTKRGVAHASTRTDRNTKEAAVEWLGGQWVLMFEYSRDWRSRIGRAVGDGPAGPWRDEIAPFVARPGRWDRHHLSTGPLIRDYPDGPLMFYNGSDPGANWAIGWVVLDQTCSRAIERSAEPLIPPPDVPGPTGQRISFASSAVATEEGYWLYFTRNDNSLFRADIRRG